MLRRMRVVAVGILVGLAAGCVAQIQVPDKVQVTDVSSGKTFTTYGGGDWSKENMIGFSFFDLDTGDRVMLKSYSTRVTQRGGVYPEASPEVVEYRYNVKRMLKANAAQGS